MAPKRVLLFTGDGKGKTTAALGMVLRAAGHGLKAVVIQFVKTDSRTGELVALAPLGVELHQVGIGFLPQTTPLPPAHAEAAQRGLALAAKTMAAGGHALVVLDEVCFAVSRGLLAESDVLAAIQAAPVETTIVLTGRGATDGLIAAADTVTEMRTIKHGYDSGIPGQEGVEF